VLLSDICICCSFKCCLQFEEYTPDEPEDIGNNVLQPQNRVNHPVVDSTTDVHSSSTCQISVAHCKTASSDSLQATCTLNVTGSKSEPVTSPSTIKSSHSSTASSPVLQDVSNKRYFIICFTFKISLKYCVLIIAVQN